MNDQTFAPAPSDADGTSRRRRKLLALGAGGLVLGIGAAVTFASWNDTEVATGDFAAGTFALESSTDGTEFIDTTPPGQALELSFDDLATNLSPQDTASSVYAVRLDQSSTHMAYVSGSVEASGGAADNLSYTIQPVSDITGATTTGAALVSNEPVTSGTEYDDMFTLTALDDVVYLQVTVSADEGLGQGETANVVWTLLGESGASL